MTSPEQRPEVKSASKEKAGCGTVLLLYIYLAIATGMAQTAYRIHDVVQTAVWLKRQIDRNRRITMRLIEKSKKTKPKDQNQT